jgi:tRNA(Arg) A34 adenosine deaminase TadA
MQEDHETYLRASIRLSEQARQKGNHPFGALLVKDGQVILTAENTVNTERDCTGHAELNLVRNASQQFDAETLSKCILYASTEPCAMCAGSIYWAGIPKVVYGCAAETLGKLAGSSLVIPCREIFARGKNRVEVIGPVLEEEAVRAITG